jgi:parallel beta-helix repeat protein
MLKLIIFFFLFFLNSILCAQAIDSILNPQILGPKTERINPSLYNQIYYVSVVAGSDETGNGLEKTPWKTISYALKKITAGKKDVRFAVFVSEGTYDQVTIVMHKNVDLYGGFNSRTWDRDIYRYSSYLDGQGVRRVVIAADSSRIDGFTIKNGLSRDHGAGILCDDTSPHISNNFIINNLVLEPSAFNRNRIHQEGNIGGGIACLYNAVPVIRNNIIYQNKTSVGTGAAIAFYGWVRDKRAPEMYVENNRIKGGWQAKVINNIIINNTSGVNDLGKTRSSSGAGISCAFEARPVIQNNLVAMNQAKGRSDAGGIYCEYFSDPMINGNWILSNIADDDGAGFYTMKLGQPLLKNNIFAGNRTTGGGVGGIRLSKEGRAIIENNTIMYNHGGGVMSVDAYMELNNNTILFNKGGYGLTYRNNFDYFKPSRITGNTFFENENGDLFIDKKAAVMPILEDNITEKKNPGIYYQLVEFEGQAYKLEFDKNTFTSKLTVLEMSFEPGIFNGRVIRINDKWSIIKEVKGSDIFIWGDFNDHERNFNSFQIMKKNLSNFD